MLYGLQFCITLSVLAAMPVELGGLDGRVIYIDTEKKFRPERYSPVPQKDESITYIPSNSAAASGEM